MRGLTLDLVPLLLDQILLVDYVRLQVDQRVEHVRVFFVVLVLDEILESVRQLV